MESVVDVFEITRIINVSGDLQVLSNLKMQSAQLLKKNWNLIALTLQIVVRLELNGTHSTSIAKKIRRK